MIDLNNSGASFANLSNPKIRTTIVTDLSNIQPFTSCIESENIISMKSGTNVQSLTTKNITANLINSSTYVFIISPFQVSNDFFILGMIFSITGIGAINSKNPNFTARVPKSIA